jgi:hypothetical protein
VAAEARASRAAVLAAHHLLLAASRLMALDEKDSERERRRGCVRRLARVCQDGLALL